MVLDLQNDLGFDRNLTEVTGCFDQGWYRKRSRITKASRIIMISMYSKFDRYLE